MRDDTGASLSGTPPPFDLVQYVRIARVDHWFKNAFVLPGFAAALLVAHEVDVARTLTNLLLGLLATSLIASANYTINEWLDADFDRLHPTKKTRPAARGLVTARLVWVQWALLAALGLGLGATICTTFFLCALALLVMGLVYNVPPVRSKDLPYLDVISESVNNPLRLLLGWSMVLDGALPPTSALLAYWMGGAFLMAIKRFAEYRFIGDADLAGRYRRSFAGYSENTLLCSAFFYAITCCFFLGVFLIKYRIEYLLGMPLIAVLFTGYLWMGLRHNSLAQRPEKLYRAKRLVGFTVFLCAVFAVLTFVDLPWMRVLLEPLEW